MDGFTKPKKKSWRRNRAAEFDESSELYFEKLCRRVDCTLDQFHDDDQLSETVNQFNEALSRLGDANIRCIVCYGLGRVSSSKNSLYQFVLIQKLSSTYGIPLSVYDPVFIPADIKLFERMKCEVLQVDDSGKRRAEGTTMFYTPHAPRFITENILRSNWGPSLTNCILFGDNLSEIFLNTPKRLLESSYPFTSECRDFVEVVPVGNKFKYLDVFNDMAFHVFTPKKLADVNPLTWDVESLIAREESHCDPG